MSLEMQTLDEEIHEDKNSNDILGALTLSNRIYTFDIYLAHNAFCVGCLTG